MSIRQFLKCDIDEEAAFSNISSSIAFKVDCFRLKSELIN